MKKAFCLNLFIVMFICILCGCENSAISEVKKQQVIGAENGLDYETMFKNYKYCKDGEWSVIKKQYRKDSVRWQAIYDQDTIIETLQKQKPDTNPEYLPFRLNLFKTGRYRGPVYIVWDFFIYEGEKNYRLGEVYWKTADDDHIKSRTRPVYKGFTRYVNYFSKNLPLIDEALPE